MNSKSLDGAPTSCNQSDKVHSQSQNLSRGGDTNLQPSEAHHEIISKGSKTSVNGDEIDEKGKNPVVQQKGRFKVTSESIEMEKMGAAVQPLYFRKATACSSDKALLCYEAGHSVLVLLQMMLE